MKNKLGKIKYIKLLIKYKNTERELLHRDKLLYEAYEKIGFQNEQLKTLKEKGCDVHGKL